MSSIIDLAPPSSPSLMSLGSSCTSSPFGLAESTIPVDHNNELEDKKRRHSKYYFEDGNITFLVEDTLYNVHRYFFARDSNHFRTILQGTDGSNTHVLSGVNCADFDEFLAILYPTDFRRSTKKTTAQWISILHLAATWDFENIKLLSIDNLAATANPVDKIVLGHRYGITEWLPGAYEDVCTRADPLTMEEGVKLGVEDVVRISAARQLYGTATTRHETKYLAGDLGEIFRLDKSSEGTPTIMDEEATIKVLEAQVADARMQNHDRPDLTPHSGPCTSSTMAYTKRGSFYMKSCGSCGDCKPHPDQGRRRRDTMEEKARQLVELKSKLQERQQELAGRQQRMASFR